MNQQQLPHELPPETAAYIAGLIDGEGTITLTRLHANENRRLVVSIGNTEIQLLQFVADQFGAGYTTLTPRNGKYTADFLDRRRVFEQAFLKLKSGSSSDERTCPRSNLEPAP